MVIGTTLVIILTMVLLIILSSLPLYMAVKFLGGKATIMKVFFTNIIVALILAVLTYLFSMGWIWILLVTVLFYSYIFSMGIFKSLIAWVLQYIFAAVLFVIVLLILGISIPAFVI